LWGGRGDDNLVGGSGDDVLVAVGGGNLDSLIGGLGTDQFWCDDQPGELTDVDSTELAAKTLHEIGAFISDTSLEPDGQNLVDPNPQDRNASTPSRVLTPVYANFKDQPLFSGSGPTASDVKQGEVEDSGLMAILKGLAAKPNVIARYVAELGDGTYVVNLHDKYQEDIFIRVDADLPVVGALSRTPYYSSLGPNGAIWVPIIEKAIATFIGTGYQALDGQSVYTPGALLGLHADSLNKGDTSARLKVMKARLAEGQIVTASTYASQTPSGRGIESHTYLVERVVTIKVYTGGSGGLIGGSFVDLVLGVNLRNTWDTDGVDSKDSNPSDGSIYLTAEQFEQLGFRYGAAIF
ncbi:MAG: C2 family cysteine protease, partial [Tepidisphaeraceae bacterium]